MVGREGGKEDRRIIEMKKKLVRGKKWYNDRGVKVGKEKSKETFLRQGGNEF